MEHENMALLVCGAHLSGMPLHSQLQERSAILREKTTTSDCYRLFSLPGGKRPGLIRDESTENKDKTSTIEVEVYNIPQIHVGTFLAGIPHPLGLGKVELISGEWVTGFICAQNGLEGAEEVTQYKGWRAYKAATAPQS